MGPRMLTDSTKPLARWAKIESPTHHSAWHSISFIVDVEIFETLQRRIEDVARGESIQSSNQGTLVFLKVLL